MENQNVKKCSYCKNEKSKSEYMSDAGRELKMCKRCRDIKSKKTICEHNKRKDVCRECGIGYCVHNKRKYECRDCETGKHKGKGPREKYHINVCSSGIVYLQWIENK